MAMKKRTTHVDDDLHERRPEVGLVEVEAVVELLASVAQPGELAEDGAARGWGREEAALEDVSGVEGVEGVDEVVEDGDAAANVGGDA